MFEGVFATLLITVALGGGLVRRWSFVLVPLVLWPLVYAGMREGWWGSGVGDGWEYAAVAVTFVSVVATASAVALGRWLAAFIEQNRGR